MSARLSDAEREALDYAYFATDCTFEDVVETVEGILASRLIRVADEIEAEILRPARPDGMTEAYLRLLRRTNPSPAVLAAIEQIEAELAGAAS